MKFGFDILRRILLLLVVAVGMGSPGYLQGQEAKPAPAGDESRFSTNRTPGASGLEALQRIEGELNRALGGGSRKSLEGMMAPPRSDTLPPPPRQVAPPPRRTMEDLEKRKNWMFLEPEDLERKPGDDTGSRDSGGGANDLKLTPMERFYLRLGGSIPGVENDKKQEDKGNKEKKAALAERQSFRDLREDELPGNLGNTAKELKKILDDRNDTLATLGRSDERGEKLFGLGDPKSFLGRKTDPSPILQQYRILLQDLGPRPTAGVSEVVNPMNSMMGGVNAGPARDSIAGQINALNKPLSPPSLPDVNAGVLNNWNPLYTPPVPQVPRQSGPAPVSFDAPRRKF